MAAGSDIGERTGDGKLGLPLLSLPRRREGAPGGNDDTIIFRDSHDRNKDETL